MNKRRTLDIALTPAEQAFLQAGESEMTGNSDTESPPAIVSPVVATSLASPGQQSIAATLEMPSRLEPFASVNTRIEPAIGAALTRASFERRMSQMEPASKRAILEEALTVWLAKHGYLEIPAGRNAPQTS
jgi:hypothetical protein